MNLTVLVDNNTILDEYYIGEHGLSFYIEDNDNSDLPEYVNYTVEAGDNLYDIAERFGTTVDKIKKDNDNLNVNINGIDINSKTVKVLPTCLDPYITKGFLIKSFFHFFRNSSIFRSIKCNHLTYFIK